MPNKLEMSCNKSSQLKLIVTKVYLFNKREQDRTLANRWYEMTWTNEFLWKKYQFYVKVSGFNSLLYIEEYAANTIMWAMLTILL